MIGRWKLIRGGLDPQNEARERSAKPGNAAVATLSVYPTNLSWTNCDYHRTTARKRTHTSLADRTIIVLFPNLKYLPLVMATEVLRERDSNIPTEQATQNEGAKTADKPAMQLDQASTDSPRSHLTEMRQDEEKQ